MATTNGKNGGLLKGKRHYDINGKSIGGIKAIVSDTGQAVELEGGEVIINREASKKYWKELSKINQSAGGGVPILPPDSVESNTEEYRLGGRTIEFNPNVLPTKWVYEYGKKIKDKYPKVWEQYANVYGNEAFENLGSALRRGHWLDGEEWFYYKWKKFNPNHKGNATLKGVLASLKWCTINSKGWEYMKSVIEKEIKNQYPKSSFSGSKMKLGGNTEVITPDNEKFITPTFVSEKELPRIFAADAEVGEVNKVIQSVKLPFKVTEILVSGAYGTAFKTNRGTVLKVTSVRAEAFASYVISKSNFKSQAKVYNVFKITDGARNIFFIEKELVKVAKYFSEEEEFPLSNLFSEAFRTGSTRVGKKFTDKRIVELANDYYLEWVDEFKHDSGNTMYGTKENGERALKELKAKKKYIVEHLYNLFIFFRDLEKESGTKEIDFNDVHDENFGLRGNKFICFDCVSSGHKSFMLGGELAKGIKVENEHKDTLDKLYKHKITPSQAPTYIAKDHLKEDKKYYTKLNKMEKKFTNGGNLKKAGLGSLKVGDKGTFKNQQVEIVQITDDRIYFKLGNNTLYRGIERFATRWKDSGGKAKSNMPDKAKYIKGQWVIFKDDIGKPNYRLYQVSEPNYSTQIKEWAYTTKEIRGGWTIYYNVPESELLDALKESNLPFVAGDKIIAENTELTISDVKDTSIILYYQDGKLFKEKGLDNWYNLNVLINLVDKKWVLKKKKEKALPYKIGDVIVRGKPNAKEETYVVSDIHTGTTYLRTENTSRIRDVATEFVIELLEKGEWYIEKPTIKLPEVDFQLSTPSGAKSRLTYLQQSLVRTEAFKKYFGDWEKSAMEYIADGKQNFEKHYKNVSKVLDLVTLEPRLMYHGTMTEKEFFVFEANINDKGRPYAYFSQNKEYAENFKEFSQRNKGTQKVMYECFLRVIKPFMAIGTNFEAVKEESGWWISVISLAITQDKYTINFTAQQLEKTIKAVESQIGKYIEKICNNSKIAFWKLMAGDKNSNFKAFLISHNYDGINYAENLGEPYDINNPAHYSMAVTLFDSKQIKLGDGRNLNFENLDSDIRYEDGGMLHQQEKTHQPELDKKHKLGKSLFGDKYQYEDGGSLELLQNHNISSERAYVDDIIAKMKK